MNAFQKLFMVASDDPGKLPEESKVPPNAERASPAPEQEEFYSKEREKSLPEQVDFASILSPPKNKDASHEIPALPQIASTMTDDQLQQIAQKVDFTNFFSEEFRQNSPEIVKEIQSALRGVYLTGLKHNAALTDAGLNLFDQRVSAKQQKSFDDFVGETPWREDELFGRPDVSPLMRPVIDKLRNEFPEAPPEWISAKAKKYLASVGKAAAQDLGEDFTPASTPAGQSGETKIDWAKYANG